MEGAGKSRKVRSERLRTPSEKLESPDEEKAKSGKPKVGSAKSTKETASAPPIGGLHSEIIKNKSEIERQVSEIEKLPAAHSKLQTETMEVHHHPEVEKKGFKEYILEGLMIFLAVLMGFIAENIRESITEHKRAAEFAQSYYESIKKDTTQLYTAIRFSKHKLAACDSTVAILHMPVTQQNDTTLYRESQVGTNVYPFHPSSGSYEQIKSSGSLRFFKQKVANLMDEYELQAKEVENREDIDLRFITDKVIPFTIMMLNIEAGYNFRFGGKMTKELYITDRSVAATRQWINYVMITKLLRMRSMQEYNKLLEVSGRVMAELKKEYDLE